MFGLGWGFRLSLDLFPRAFIHALQSRVTLASAGLSCFILVTENYDGSVRDLSVFLLFVLKLELLLFKCSIISQL